MCSRVQVFLCLGLNLLKREHENTRTLEHLSFQLR